MDMRCVAVGEKNRQTRTTESQAAQRKLKLSATQEVDFEKMDTRTVMTAALLALNELRIRGESKSIADIIQVYKG